MQDKPYCLQLIAAQLAVSSLGAAHDKELCVLQQVFSVLGPRQWHNF